MLPETKYVQSGDVHIAYQVIGNGPRDLLIVPGFISHLEQAWEDAGYTRFLQHLTSFSRLIRFDKRGTGLSDRVAEMPTLEQRMDDVRLVMDAVGSKRAALFGVSEGGPMSVLFAATYPERTTGLILYGSIARGSWAPDFPLAPKLDAGWEAWLEDLRKQWGGPVEIEMWAPSMAQDVRFRDWFAKYLRLGGSPSAVVNIFRMSSAIDVRAILPAIRVPTLVLHRVGDRAVNIGHGRYLAQHIPGAKLVELPGDDHIWWVGDSDAITNEIEEFLTGERGAPEPDRILVTVLFTDIVDFHPPRDRAGRPPLARPARQPQRRAASGDWPLPGPRRQEHGRRLPRHLRWPGPRHLTATCATRQVVTRANPVDPIICTMAPPAG